MSSHRRPARVERVLIVLDNQLDDLRRSRPDLPGRLGGSATRVGEAGAHPGGRRRARRWGGDRVQRFSLARSGAADDGLLGPGRIRDADVCRGHERAGSSARTPLGTSARRSRGRDCGSARGAFRHRRRAGDRNRPRSDLRAPAGERIGGNLAAGFGGAAAARGSARADGDGASGACGYRRDRRASACASAEPRAQGRPRRSARRRLRPSAFRADAPPQSPAVGAPGAPLVEEARLGARPPSFPARPLRARVGSRARRHQRADRRLQRRDC